MNKIVRHPYFYPTATTLLFVFAILTGVLPLPRPKAGGIDWVSLVSKSLLGLGFLLLAAWFLHAFTHADPDGADKSCQAEQRASMFRFAYMFSLFSFALLVLPFTAMLRTHETPPDAGPIRLLRACVQPQPPARSASGVPGPVDLCPDPLPAGAMSYPWLVSVGGVVAQECGTGEFKCSKPIAPPGASAASAAAAASATAASPPLYAVQGGFVVPFYVIVFSFVGGIVNLTRRIPEYQKRSSCNFAGTPTETPVTLLEAREFVVFQLMQLLSSPFVAMVAYYALEPKSIASAVGLAFISGFATESVLLLIRGMVNGLKPETTKTTASASTTTAQLHVVIRRGGAASVDKTKVELRRLPLPNASPPLKAAVADAAGEVEFKGLASGSVWVVATLDVPGPPPGQLTATQKVELKTGQTESVELTLV